MFFIIDRLKGIIIHKIPNFSTSCGSTIIVKGLEVYKGEVLSQASDYYLSLFEIDKENGIEPFKENNLLAK